MALKDKWKNAGKSIGGAFKNFGKAMKTTAKVAFSDEEEKVDENGETELKKAWKDTGKGFGKAGKSVGTAAKGTAQKVVGDEEKEKEPAKPSEDEVVDVESKEVK